MNYEENFCENVRF